MSNKKNSLLFPAPCRAYPAALVSGLAALSLLFSPASAQTTIEPPKHTSVDGNGVDLISGLATFSQLSNSIGGQGADGLSETQMLRAGSPISSLYSFVVLKYSSEDISSTVSFLGK